MKPLIIITTLAATASASAFRLWSAPSAAATKDKPTTVVSHKFDQHSHKSPNHQSLSDKLAPPKQNQKHKAGQHQQQYTHHHRLHGNDNQFTQSYSYRYQRSNSNPGKAVVYAPDRVHAVPAHDKAHGEGHKIKLVQPRAADELNALSLTEPPPCQPISPPPDEDATKARFDKFAHAFLVTKNITEAFTYISEGYINHNPAAKNGAASAWGILSPIWASQSITVLRTTFKGNMGWLNYKAGGLGEVVDRYRWDAGCIAEHWDQGEKYPSS
ncbi:hypothetical protein SCUCBS95973_003081 [Sporothrix curviconia]|uniref:Uncharacterized protein n=1 Tax=Sporothrix curviconia TaxID=1260050 RepID=A0ABP0BCB5_9PEZI